MGSVDVMEDAPARAAPLATQVAVLAERVDQSQKQNEKRMDSIEKKLDDALTRYATKEDLERAEKEIAKLRSWFEWLWKIVGTFVVGGILTAVFKSGLLHS